MIIKDELQKNLQIELEKAIPHLKGWQKQNDEYDKKAILFILQLIFQSY